MSFRCWSWWWAGVHPRFLSLEIIKVDPLFIASNNTYATINFFSFAGQARKSRWTNGSRWHFQTTHAATSWIFPIACKRLETHIGVTFNFFANSESVWHGLSYNNACSSASFNFFGCPERFLSSTQSTLKLPLSKRWNHPLNVLSDTDS